MPLQHTHSGATIVPLCTPNLIARGGLYWISRTLGAVGPATDLHPQRAYISNSGRQGIPSRRQIFITLMIVRVHMHTRGSGLGSWLGVQGGLTGPRCG